jgi:ppGpp synthetase/RelA/SpoT-type nucleotidyltranferase
MTIESDFLDRWRKEEPAYSAWGRFVGATLSDSIRGRVAPVKLELFLKLPVIPRIKGQDSLLQKAFYRGKTYENPYEEIEDKVGVRFVVLLAEDIRTIEAAINDETGWVANMARDFEQEREVRPYEFDYQSLHYIVRSALPFEFQGCLIPADLPCEVQIRTLLQHAYSELTHDTIYKPSVRATPVIKRTAAKSMALIESTSDYFSAVNKIIRQALADSKKIGVFLSSRYASITNTTAEDSPLNSLLLDRYHSQLSQTFETDFEAWWSEKDFLAGTIIDRAKGTALYRTPSILLVYFCVSTAPTLSKQDSPLTEKELQPIYSDLGLALSGA